MTGTLLSRLPKKGCLRFVIADAVEGYASGYNQRAQSNRYAELYQPVHHVTLPVGSYRIEDQCEQSRYSVLHLIVRGAS